jgi:hypothetical protein
MVPQVLLSRPYDVGVRGKEVVPDAVVRGRVRVVPVNESVPERPGADFTKRYRP